MENSKVLKHIWVATYYALNANVGMWDGSGVTKSKILQATLYEEYCVIDKTDLAETVIQPSSDAATLLSSFTLPFKTLSQIEFQELASKINAFLKKYNLYEYSDSYYKYNSNLVAKKADIYNILKDYIDTTKITKASDLPDGCVDFVLKVKENIITSAEQARKFEYYKVNITSPAYEKLGEYLKKIDYAVAFGDVLLTYVEYAQITSDRVQKLEELKHVTTDKGTIKIIDDLIQGLV